MRGAMPSNRQVRSQSEAGVRDPDVSLQKHLSRQTSGCADLPSGLPGLATDY